MKYRVEFNGRREDHDDGSYVTIGEWVIYSGERGDIAIATCDTEFGAMAVANAFAIADAVNESETAPNIPRITFHGSITDLATDVAPFLKTERDVKMFIDQLLQKVRR